MEHLQQFLESQDIIQIAPKSEEPWITNVMFLAESPEQLYFAGNLDTAYGRLLKKTSSIAFATAWHAEDDHINRKGIQGVGTCKVVEDKNVIEKVVSKHNENYPTLAGLVKHSTISDPEANWYIFEIKPSYIKFWNDELYGTAHTKEFKF